MSIYKDQFHRKQPLLGVCRAPDGRFLKPSVLLKTAALAVTCWAAAAFSQTSGPQSVFEPPYPGLPPAVVETLSKPSPTATRDPDAMARHTYFTGGTHNDVECDPPQKCVYERKDGEPQPDPQFPQWWSSDWTMYRVFKSEKLFPPPYANPPQHIPPSHYEVSYGATFYDNTYRSPDGKGTGAMMEHYVDKCLPIFPSANNYTCSFVSLGDKAYFLTYDNRPKGMPQCCQFSLDNHPPRQDFIKHLPYSKQRSSHLNSTIQAYAMEVGPQHILFGYSFEKEPRADLSVNPPTEPYKHPQSFYFSGYPLPPVNAPIVSQNYTNFRAERPDPSQTWMKVYEMCTPNPGWCCLFAGDCSDGNSNGKNKGKAGKAQVSDWANLK